ncbi:hypothetical protein GOBAR_DD20947 [Gossypium barbadense]|nr:hypothetical protein GOBAR_DD20947 [Gossypium barbadense]
MCRPWHKGHDDLTSSSPSSSLSPTVCSGRLKKPPIDALRPIISNNAYILCIIAAAGTELPDAYSSNTIISTSLGKVHDPLAFYLYAALLRQAFAHCRKFTIAASHKSLGRVSVLVWLIILLDQLLIIILGISSRFQLLFPSQGQVLIRYLPVRH